MKALGFIYDYLRNCKQRTKKDNAYSSWKKVLPYREKKSAKNDEFFCQ